MRKALSRDVQKKSVIPQKNPVRPEDIEFQAYVFLLYFKRRFYFYVSLYIHVLVYKL